MMKTQTMDYRMFPLYALAWGLLVVSQPAFAQQQPANAGVEPRSQAAANDVALPGCLEKLSLTQRQQDQIKQIVRDYDADVASVWKQFGDRYMETIRTEVLLLSAIEDNLTEAQRQQVRSQRRETAHRQKKLAGTDTKPNQATTQPASAVEEGMAVVGISLTAEQELAADKVQEKYLSHLRSLNRDIQGLHIRLVSLEADKFVEIENVLTKDQLLKLREIRQTAPAEHRITAGNRAPAKTR